MAASENRPKRPAPKTAFAKGKSGNPGGRPKKTPEQRRVEEMARDHTASALKTLVDIMGQKKAPPNARVSAACAVLDRGWGRAPQVVEVTNPEDKPFQVAHLPPEVAMQIYLERVRGQIPK